MEEYKAAYRLAFDYHAKYAPFPPTLELWAEYSTAGGNSEFLNSLLLAVMDEFGRKWKAEQGT